MNNNIIFNRYFKMYLLFFIFFLNVFYINCVNFNNNNNFKCNAIKPRNIFLNNIINSSNKTWYYSMNLWDDEDECSIVKQNLHIKEKNLINTRSISKHIFSHLPPIVPTQSSNPTCAKHSQIYLNSLKNLELWALKMYDGSAKIPSGLLNGNVNQFGDYDLCVDSKHPEQEHIQGQYCLSYIELDIENNSHNDNLKHILYLMKSFSPFKSKFEDPGHRVPRFSSINWALCVPKSCSPQDVESSLKSTLDKYLDKSGLKYRVKVDPEMCQIKTDYNPAFETILAGIFFLTIFAVIGVMTALEFFELVPQNPNTLQQCLMGFSLIKNTKRLISMDRAPDDIESIHGIRALNAVMLLISHKSMAVFFNPYSNRTQMASNLGKPWTVLARAASLYTDPFIMLSGLLTAYSFLKQFEKNKKINVVKEIVSRCCRLLPTLGALILFCTFILPFLGSGPQWNLVVTHHATICKQYWWRNMVFIHNYFGFKNMCLTHTHHVGIDTQLFFVSPLLVWMVWKYPKNGFIALGFFAAISTILRFVVTYQRQLTLFIHFGNPVSKMFDTADYSYILPTHRLTVYAMGIALAYLLRHCGRDFKLKKSHITLGWCIASGLIYQSVVIPSKMGDLNYKYDPLDAANYAAFAPITWCLVFMWVIFLSYTGNGGFLGKLSSWRGFLFCTRVSYTFYLTQFPIFFYNVATTRSSQPYSFGLLINLKEILAIVLASVILTLTFEMPFQNVRSTILKANSKPAIQSKFEQSLINNNNNNNYNNKVK